jgi:inner membrane transporter RhtA
MCSGIGASLAAALATKTFDQVSPAAASAFGFTVAGLVLVGTVRPRPVGWSPARWGASAYFGMAVLANIILLYLALDHLPLGTTITIEFLGPLAVALHHAKVRRDYFAVAFALAGVALVTGASVTSNVVGLVFALASAATWAAYMLAARRVGAYPDPAAGLAVAIGIAGMAALPLTAIACLQCDTVGVFMLLLAVAVLGRILPYACEFVGLRLLPAGSAGVLYSVIPVIATLTGVVVLGQAYTGLQVLGLGIVVAGSALVLSDAPPEG